MQEFLQVRGVKTLLHFTNILNLPSILTNGLLPRNYLSTQGQPFQFNDHIRLDGCDDATCLSVSFPNYKMFYRMRMERPTVEWVVLAIDAKILWEKDCAFCIENAARNTVTDIPIFSRKGISACQKIFGDIEGFPKRATLGIPDHYATHPQAEILVFNKIEPVYIKGAYCGNVTRANKLGQEYADFRFIDRGIMFGPRKDYRHWS